MKDLTDLRKIAEEATPGPWEWGEETDDWGDCGPNLETVERGPKYSDGSQGAQSEVVGSWGHDANGVSVGDEDKLYLATFDPPTVLDLINRLEQAEQAVTRVREVAAHRKDIRLDYILLNDLTRALEGEQS